MRELAYIQTIGSLDPIPGADKIEKATVLGWELVVKKSDFNVGDLCVFVEIDSILPELPCFEFMLTRKHRVKTIKLKGQVSQGIAFPLSIITEVNPSFDLSSIKIGQDLTDILKITKYDPEASLDVSPPQVKKTWFQKKTEYYKWKLFGIKKVKSGDFPSDIPKTNEERVQRMGGEIARNENKIMYITEKCEGSSSTFVYRRSGNFLAKLFGKDYTFQICSRNRIVFNSQNGNKSDHNLYKIAERYKILSGLKKLNRNIAIQGELIGPKIQGNIYKLPDVDFRAFLMFDIDKQEYLPFNEMVAVAEKLGLKTVPIIETVHLLKNDIKYYVELSKGKSQINSSIDREGIVIRGLVGNFSFKSINPEYLLKQG